MAFRRIVLVMVFLLSAPAALRATAAATGPATKSAESISLKQRCAPGRYVLTQTTQQQQEVMADGVRRPTQRISQTIVSAHEIGAPDPAGRQKVLIAFRGIKQRIEIGKKVISYDSAGPAGDQDPNLAAVFEALKAVRLVATIGPDGKVQNGGLLAETWKQLADRAPSLKSVLPHLRKAVTDGIVKALPARAGQVLPPRPVAVGQQWQVKVTFEMPFGGEVSYVQNCRLKSVETTAAGRTAVIDFSGTFESDKEFSAELRGSKLKIIKTRFTEAGQMEVKTDLGMAVREKVHQEGEMELSITGRDGQVTRMHLKQKLDREDSIRPDDQPQTAPATRPAGQQSRS